ncbi:MAG: aspartate-semialdehyde dehydrogenase, partial [Deltaproteobacteria bacterium]|nr:aspartate-semialdehyde dehydrogenase [Deltaproteobacteria bacterium]
MNQVRKFRIAVCGATGAVGREMVKVLAERDFPVANLTLLASERSAGERMTFGGREFSVEVLNNRSFAGVDLALFSAGGAVSKTYAPIAAEAGCVVIDNTSAFRMDPEIPLVVPEVNPQALDDFSKKSIIANPNCSTIQLVVVLKPIEDAVGLKRVVVSTYQAVSGVGKAGVNELEAQCLSLFNMQPLVCNKFERQIAFNCLPHIGDFAEDGYTFEEHKLIDETRKILGKPGLRVTATTVRVPVFYSHSEA